MSWCLLSKNNFVQKNVRVFITFQPYHVTQRIVGHNNVGSQNKSIKPSLRPRPKLQDQDQDEASLRPVLSQDRGLRPQDWHFLFTC